MITKNAGFFQIRNRENLAITLTSGGSGLLRKRLLPILNHEQVILTEDLESIHLANLRGGLKLWRLYEALQVL